MVISVTITVNLNHTDGVVQQPPLPHIIDPRMVDRLLKDTCLSVWDGHAL